jgi:hypothetical protein
VQPAASAQDEVNSLQMQIVAMEQDYESQIEELRSEVEEARAHETLVTKLKKQVAKLEKLKPNSHNVAPVSPRGGLGGPNPLMSDVPVASPFSNDEFERLTTSLNVLQVVNNAVWSAQLEYQSGVAVSCGLILRSVEDEAGGVGAMQLYDKLEAAIHTAAANQQGLGGKMYWLNAVTNVLARLSSSVANSGIDSPQDCGVVVLHTGSKQVPVLKKQTSSIKEAMDIFTSKMVRLAFELYKLVVRAMYARIGPYLVDAVLSGGLNASESLGARHNAGAAVNSEFVVGELDFMLGEAIKAHLFPAVVKQMFQQLFHNMNAELFNSLVKRKDLTASRSIEIKLAVSHFDSWPSIDIVDNATKGLLRSVGAMGLNSMKEVCNLLLVDKATFLMEGAFLDFAPSLNAVQIGALLSAFVPDQLCPDRTPVKVLDDLSGKVKKGDRLEMEIDEWVSFE